MIFILHPNLGYPIIMIDYKKELSYFKNGDGTHVRCEIDLAPTGIIKNVPDLGIVISHDILFSQYMVPLELSHGIVTTVDLNIRLPRLNHFSVDQDDRKKLECSFRSLFSSLSNLSHLEELYIVFHADDCSNGDGEKKRRLLPNITKNLCLGELFLQHTSKIVMQFDNIPGQSFSFECIMAPNLERIETNFAAPCMERRCLLFHREHGKPLMNQCFASFPEEDSNDQFIVQGFNFDKEITGGCGLQYELEEEIGDGGLFSISKIHFKEITGCDVLRRITVRCGNQYPRGNESRMMQPGW